MGTGRLEAFSDGVLAIIITIMVLELKVPHGEGLNTLDKLYPIAVSYILSFVTIGIYWNNHHHLMHSVEHINGTVMWANMHLLFWLSLIPFGSGWMGENSFTLWPVVVYGIILVMSGIAYFLLVRSLVHLHGTDSMLAKAVGNDKKGRFSVLMFASGVGLAFLHPLAGFLMYVFVTAFWFIPDRRIEKKIEQVEQKHER
ncbi:MAG TPA: TMEM175 family protein [Segetibacter sp.]|nr:TMEM175 family protein [Segetibacter sp.]